MDALEKIKDIDLRDLLPAGVDLGLTNTCKCPLHSERTPSFKYYPTNNSWRCYGCNTGGSVIDFWMHLRGYDFRAAVEDLAGRYHIELAKFTPEQEKRAIDDRRREAALTFAANYYAEQLKPGTEQWLYLAGRGWSEDTIRDVRLGWAGKTLYSYVARHPQKLTEAGLCEQDLIDVGVLVKDKEDGHIYEHLRNRIVFPLLKRGKCVGMSGRAFNNDAALEKGRKYVNLAALVPCLYMEDNVRNEVYLAEGLPDTITLHQMGLPAVGLPGTGGVDKHVHKLARCQRVYLCFDTDEAGQKAIAKNGRAIHFALKAGEVRVMMLPSHRKDVSEWVMAGAGREDIVQLASNAPSLLDWLIAKVPEGLSPLESERAIGELLELVVPMGPVQRAQALDSIKGRFKGVKAPDLNKMLKKIEGQKEQPGEPTAGPTMRFETSRERIPAQDFAFNSPATGNTCVYLPVDRPRYDEDGTRQGNAREEEPVMITVTHNEGKMSVEYKPIADMDLTDRERSRVPFENTVKGRWYLEGRRPYSVEQFVRGEAPKVNGWSLFGDVCGVYRRYSWLKQRADYDLLGAYIMLSYCFQLFDAIGYLHLTGTRESGKSNIARLIEELGFNPAMSSNQTGAVLFRSIEANCGIRILEEAERLVDPKPDTPNYDLMLMCNAGYKRGARAERMKDVSKKEGARDFDIASFDIYSPKVFVSINDLHHVLASRCVTINCVRATREDLDGAGIRDLVQNMGAEKKVLAELRARLHCWMLQSFPDVLECYQALNDSPDLVHLMGREREMWMPLLALAYHVDSERALLEAGGDVAKATDIIQARQDAGAVNLDESELVFDRLVSIQKGKERNRRADESDQSIEIATMRACHRLITDGDIGPTASDLNGTMFAIKDLAHLVSADLQDAGLLFKDRTLSGRKLAAILYKTGVVNQDDQREIKAFDPETSKRKTIRCVPLTAIKLESTILRLGGRM